MKEIEMFVVESEGHKVEKFLNHHEVEWTADYFLNDSGDDCYYFKTDRELLNRINHRFHVVWDDENTGIIIGRKACGV